MRHGALEQQQALTGPPPLLHAQGTASTLTRSEVRGGGKKPYKQKGTGGARRGSSTSPLFPGGGISFGPKVRAAARRWAAALTLTAANGYLQASCQDCKEHSSTRDMALWQSSRQCCCWCTSSSRPGPGPAVVEQDLSSQWQRSSNDR